MCFGFEVLKERPANVLGLFTGTSNELVWKRHRLTIVLERRGARRCGATRASALWTSGVADRQLAVNGTYDALLHVERQSRRQTVVVHRELSFVTALGEDARRRDIARDVVGVRVDPYP